MKGVLGLSLVLGSLSSMHKDLGLAPRTAEKGGEGEEEKEKGGKGNQERVPSL